VDDIDLGLELVISTLLGLLGGSVGTGVCAGLADAGWSAGHKAQGNAPKLSPPMVIFLQSAS
jgi:hypothetical protein